jgi:hypothetical protein
MREYPAKVLLLCPCFLKLSHKNLTRRLPELRSRRTHEPSRQSKTPQLLVIHFAELGPHCFQVHPAREPDACSGDGGAPDE